VIVLPIIDWGFRFQPLQLASMFADAGQRVFYLATIFSETGAPFSNRSDRGSSRFSYPARPPCPPTGMNWVLQLTNSRKP
jgi:hypothetical protein